MNTGPVVFENNGGGHTGVLVLDNAGAFKGTVAGMYADNSNSDTLDLENVKFTTGVTWSFKQNTLGKGTLTVSDHSGDTASLTLLGQYLSVVGSTASSAASSPLFQVASDGNPVTAGTLVTTTHH